MQFLIKFLPDLAGRGLPINLILELIVYNLAYMVVLAVPMAVLLSSLMAFGELAKGVLGWSSRTVAFHYGAWYGQSWRLRRW